jgi:hypothetical protein
MSRNFFRRILNVIDVLAKNPKRHPELREGLNVGGGAAAVAALPLTMVCPLFSSARY